jgi:hypothetical protein
MQAFGPGFSLARRSSTSRQGSSRFPGGITVCQPSGSLAILPSWRPNGPFIGGIPVKTLQPGNLVALRRHDPLQFSQLAQ